MITTLPEVGPYGDGLTTGRSMPSVPVAAGVLQLQVK